MCRWEKIENNKVSLEVEVPEEEVNDALHKAYLKVVKNVSIPGFRKGKVPRRILEARFGPEVLYEDALEMLLQPAYVKAIEETELEPISQPELELVQMEKDKPLIFKAKIDVKPEVTLCNYRELTVEHVEEEITAEDVERYLQALREQHSRLVTLEQGEAQEKDLVVIDFQGEVDGEPFEGSEAENYSLEIGSKSFIEGFEEQLIGASQGEEREVRVTFPDDYPEKLGGKEAVFQVKVKEIKRPQLPELDDAFVQELTEEFSTLEEFRADVESRLKTDRERRQKVQLESKIIERVAEESEMEVPEVLVERELDNLLGEFEYYLRLQGLSLEQYGQLVEGGLDRLREERRDEAYKKARANLMLDALIKEENIEAADEEINEKIREIANNQDVEIEKVKELFEKQGRLDVIAHEIRYRKAIDHLVENVNIVKAARDEVEKGQAEPEQGGEAAEATGEAVAVQPGDAPGEGAGNIDEPDNKNGTGKEMEEEENGSEEELPDRQDK